MRYNVGIIIGILLISAIISLNNEQSVIALILSNFSYIDNMINLQASSVGIILNVIFIFIILAVVKIFSIYYTISYYVIFCFMIGIGLLLVLGTESLAYIFSKYVGKYHVQSDNNIQEPILYQNLILLFVDYLLLTIFMVINRPNK